MTRDELVDLIDQSVSADSMASDVYIAFVDFVAQWIGEHNGWGDEGAYYNAILWRMEMAPKTLTAEEREDYRRQYGELP